MPEVTRILSEIEAGNPQAAEQLLPLVYDELRKLAAAKMAHEPPGQTLQATALVHEAYLRLVGDDGLRWNSRNHFFAAAAQAMRRILVDSARRKASRKHGGDLSRKSLLDSGIAVAAPPNEVIAVHEALDRFRSVDGLAAELVILHYFGGFPLEEAGELLGMSRATAYRRWTYARAWLRGDLESAKKSTSATDG